MLVSNRGRALVLLLSLLSLLNISLSIPHASASGVFRFPIFYEPISFDPTKDRTNSNIHVFQQVYDGLVAYDRNLRVVPGLAESWSVSKDGREYLFTLRKNILFHNGKEFTARDVVASLTRIFKPGSEKVTGKVLDRIEGAIAYREGRATQISGLTARSDHQVIIKLVEPYAPFLSVLAMPLTKIVPKDLAEDPAEPLSEKPVGTGPFRFYSREGTVITLRANRDYFLDPPDLDEIRFILYSGGDREKAYEDFLKGDLDGCPLPGSVDPSSLRAQGFQVLVRPRLSLQFYGMLVDTPPFDNPDLRKALALAFDRETYAREVLGSNHYPAFQILPPGMPGYTPDNALLKYDPDGASRLLEKAGYPDGKGLPDLVIASSSHSDVAVKELELFSSDLARIGVTVKPEFVKGWGLFKEGLKQGKYTLFRYAWFADVPDPDDMIAVLFESGAPSNYTGFSDSNVDDLFEKARLELDQNRRVGLYRRAERIILDKAPLIPVIHISTQVAFQKTVKGIDLPAIGTPFLPLRSVSILPEP